MPFYESGIPPKGMAEPPRAADSDASLPRMIYQDLRWLLKKFWLLAIVGLAIYLLLEAAMFVTQSGYIYLYDNPLSHKLEVYDKPGIQFKIPFSQVTRYKHVWIVDFGTGYAGEQIRRSKAPITLRFADSYTVKIPATFRYKLPSARDRLERIHQDFTTHEKLVDALLIPISRDVMVNTATQYTGEEFFQGGLNQFRMHLENQLQYGIYKTERQEVEMRKRHLAVFGSEDGLMPDKTTSLKVWKTVPIVGPDGEIERLEKKSLVEYGIEVIQVTLGVPVPEPELEQLLADKKRFDIIANKKADDLALVMEDQRIHLANIGKEKTTEKANIVKEEETEKARKAKELAIVKEEEKIQLAHVQKETKIKLARKAEELALVEEEEKINLAQVEKQKKIKLAQKAEELALVEEEKKIHLAQVEKQKETQLAMIDKEQEMELAKKAEELALVEEEKKIQLAQVEKEKNIQMANKAKELALVEEDKKIQLAQVEKEQKIQLAQVEKDKNTQLANKARELVLVKESEKIQLANKAEELAIVEAEKKIQLAKKAEELAIAQEEQKIQAANFEVAQYEAKVLREKGLAEAEVLKAQYQARIPEMYLAEIQREIAQVIYPNLKGVEVTMPHNIVNLGDKDNKVQTNLDVLSSFATLGVMKELEEKAK